MGQSRNENILETIIRGGDVSELPPSQSRVEVLLKQLGSVYPELVTDLVNAWLDDHPEATTTVEDGSISYAKLDSTLKGKADDVDDLKSAVSTIEDVTGATVNITNRVSFTANKGVRWNDGTLSENTTRAYSNYVDIADFDSILITMIKAVSSATYGIAFYSAQSTDAYISGFAMNTGAETPTAEERKFSIPDGAKYFRTTWFDTDADQYSQYTFSCLAYKTGVVQGLVEDVAELQSESETMQDDLAEAQENITELLPMKGAVEVKNPNIINFGKHTLTVGDVTIVINGDTITVNGTVGSSAIRLKVTGEVEYDRSSSNPTRWNSETVDYIEIGKTYNTYAQLMSGTVTGTGDVFTFRDGTGTTVLSESKGTQTIAARVAYGLFYIKYGQVFNNAVYRFVLTESEQKIPVDEVSKKTLDPEITVPYAEDLLKSVIPFVAKEYSSEAWFAETTYAGTHEMQGVATDGTYLYYCMHGATDADNSVVGKIRIADKTLISEVADRSYKHANGLCYYPDGNELRIAPLANSGVIYRVDADTLEYKGEYDIGAVIGETWTEMTGATLSVAGIAYDSERDLFVYLLAKTSGLYHGLAVCDSENNLIKIIRCLTDYTALRGGIACDRQFIYLCLGDVDGARTKALLRAYDWNGNVLNDAAFTSPHTFEGISFGDRIFASSANNTITELTETKSGFVALTEVLTHLNPN